MYAYFFFFVRNIVVFIALINSENVVKFWPLPGLLNARKSKNCINEKFYLTILWSIFKPKSKFFTKINFCFNVLIFFNFRIYVVIWIIREEVKYLFYFYLNWKLLCNSWISGINMIFSKRWEAYNWLEWINYYCN